jgi:hypothetical protein
MRKRILYIILGLLVAIFIIVNGFSSVFSNAIEDLNLSYRIDAVIHAKLD